jgi:hypothetical protein
MMTICKITHKSGHVIENWRFRTLNKSIHTLKNILHVYTENCHMYLAEHFLVWGITDFQCTSQRQVSYNFFICGTCFRSSDCQLWGQWKCKSSASTTVYIMSEYRCRRRNNQEITMLMDALAAWCSGHRLSHRNSRS